ncbi:hypothetical protein BDK51DRAFT_43040 [Blyttiomyces helicus]|uniref:Uncharacterized protein n=1 Tax=Blyttiomyces helicus TaxID=388810 RepID=A0A4P9W374_9FUNG|nr:hypothetical protein BDK51DRAFT_43040 [Blyttiomyces helicus]|eukprot:RKO85673.1 hypothetical protein BDK51DRAFT_43040 [Blyttiomyces helicus]
MVQRQPDDLPKVLISPKYMVIVDKQRPYWSLSQEHNDAACILFVGEKEGHCKWWVGPLFQNLFGQLAWAHTVGACAAQSTFIWGKGGSKAQLGGGAWARARGERSTGKGAEAQGPLSIIWEQLTKRRRVKFEVIRSHMTKLQQRPVERARMEPTGWARGEVLLDRGEPLRLEPGGLVGADAHARADVVDRGDCLVLERERLPVGVDPRHRQGEELHRCLRRAVEAAAADEEGAATDVPLNISGPSIGNEGAIRDSQLIRNPGLASFSRNKGGKSIPWDMGPGGLCAAAGIPGGIDFRDFGIFVRSSELSGRQEPAWIAFA